MVKVKEWLIFLSLGGIILLLFAGVMLYSTGTHTYFREELGKHMADLQDMVITMKSQTFAPGEETYSYEKFVVPEDVYLTGLVPEFEGNTRLFHYGQLLALGKKNAACPDFPLYLFAIGAEMKAMDGLLPGYGIPMKKGTQLLLGVHLANSTGTTTSGFLRLHLRATQEKQKPVEPVVLSIVDLCSEATSATDVSTEYLIPGGVAHDESHMQKPFVMPADARLLGFGGHVHTYGKELQLLKNGELVSRLMPGTNPIQEPDPTSVYLEHEVFLDRPVEFKKGDVVDMVAVYDKPRELFYKGAMGTGYLLFDFDTR